MAKVAVPFSTSDPLEQVTLEHGDLWLTAVLFPDATIIISDNAGELHRYQYFGRKTDIPAIIESVETAISNFEHKHGPLQDRAQEGPQ